MRDDLHRSVAPRTPWARVLRLACHKATDDELRVAAVRAVRRDTEWLATPWGKRFEATLDLGAGDLFAQEMVRAELSVLEKSCPSQHARTSCEIALGQLAREGTAGADFKTKVMDQTMRTQAADCIELVASRVSGQFDVKQGSMVRRRLTEVLSDSDLTHEPPKRAAGRKSTIDEDLDGALELKL